MRSTEDLKIRPRGSSVKPIVETLPNGVRVVVDPMPSLGSAAIGVWARAGALDEAPAENGISHLLEHMAFKGTKRRSARRIAEEMEEVGGYLNAATSYAHTGYFARVLAVDVHRAFDVIADILNSPSLADAELQREKEVVVQEIGEAWDAPDDALFDILQGLAFADQPLGRPILGTPETVRAAEADHLRAYIKRCYAASDLIVCASGAVDPDDIKRLATTYFGDRAMRQSPRAERVSRHTAGARAEHRALEQTHLAMSFPGVSLCEEDYFATRVFVEVLGGGMSSRLFQEVREARGLAYSVYAYADAYEDIGALGFYAGVDHSAAEEALNACLDQLEALASGAGEEETARARAMLASSIVMGLESPLTRIERAAAMLFAHGRIPRPDDIAARVYAVEADDVARAARRVLKGGAGSLAVVGGADFDSLRRVCEERGVAGWR